MTEPESRHDFILAQTVHIRGENVPFGELTVDDARSRADELRASVGWGPMARIAPVAMAWRELMMAMEKAGAETVSAVDADIVDELAPRMWVVPPGGGLIGS